MSSANGPANAGIYSEYFRTLSRRVAAAYESISAEYNFDLGDEFEIALGEVLRLAMPSKYGICRGFVEGPAGTKAGDDLIVFDRHSFPTLEMRNDLSRKERVPAEAVYGYIEVKHTVHLHEGDSRDDSQSLRAAADQVAQVKQVCAERAPRLPQQLGHLTFIGIPQIGAEEFPRTRNPPWGGCLR